MQSRQDRDANNDTGSLNRPPQRFVASLVTGFISNEPTLGSKWPGLLKGIAPAVSQPARALSLRSQARARRGPRSATDRNSSASRRPAAQRRDRNRRSAHRCPCLRSPSRSRSLGPLLLYVPEFGIRKSRGQGAGKMIDAADAGLGQVSTEMRKKYASCHRNSSSVIPTMPNSAIRPTNFALHPGTLLHPHGAHLVKAGRGLLVLVIAALPGYLIRWQ